MQPLRILVADDNEEFRIDLENYLKKRLGVKVIGQAKDGLEAIYYVSALHPDVVLLDVSMPRMSGFEAAKRIKTSSPSTKIVFVTIHENKTYEALAQVLEVDGFVCKSTLNRDLPVVLRRIHKHLWKKSHTPS